MPMVRRPSEQGTAPSAVDPDHEAIRDLVRAREAAMEDLREKRQHLQSFLPRHGRIYAGRRPWTKVHARWLAALIFEHPAQYLVIREYRQAIEDAETRLDRLMQHVTELVSSWSMAPVVEAYQAMRGVALLTAITFVVPPHKEKRTRNLSRRLSSPSNIRGCVVLEAGLRWGTLA